jgi:hypothetical protein
MSGVPLSDGNTRSSSPAHSLALRHSRSSDTSSGSSGTSRRPYFVLGRLDPALSERTAHAHTRLGPVEAKVSPLQRKQLRDSEPRRREDAEHRPVPGMDDGKEGRELLARQCPDLLSVLVAHLLPVRERRAGRRVVARPPLSHRRGEAGAHRVEDVADGRVGQLAGPAPVRRIASR